MILSKIVLFSFDSWSTDRKTVDSQLDYQVDIGSAENINSLKYLIVAHQTAARIGVPNRTKNIAIFNNLDVKKIMLILMVFAIHEMVLILIMD